MLLAWAVRCAACDNGAWGGGGQVKSAAGQAAQSVVYPVGLVGGDKVRGWVRDGMEGWGWV